MLVEVPESEEVLTVVVAGLRKMGLEVLLVVAALLLR